MHLPPSAPSVAHSLGSLLRWAHSHPRLTHTLGSPTRSAHRLAKVADVFGRTELIIVSIVFYVVGTIIEAAATGVRSFCAGAVFYQIGYTAIILLVEVTIGDTTSLRSRLFFSYIPALPFLVSSRSSSLQLAPFGCTKAGFHCTTAEFLTRNAFPQINTWVSGDVTSAVLAGTTWRWGVGLWCIVYPGQLRPLSPFSVFVADPSTLQSVAFLSSRRSGSPPTEPSEAASSTASRLPTAKSASKGWLSVSSGSWMSWD